METQLLDIVTALFLSSGVDTNQYTPADALCLSQVVYLESRGESRQGQEAVAHVVLNRTEDERFPDNVCGVVRQNGQFAPQVRRAPGRLAEPDAFKRAAEVAVKAMSGSSTDPTRGATYFYSGSRKPGWAKSMKLSARINGHKFMRRKRE